VGCELGGNNPEIGFQEEQPLIETHANCFNALVESFAGLFGQLGGDMVKGEEGESNQRQEGAQDKQAQEAPTDTALQHA
jgi:hypothetical protein